MRPGDRLTVQARVTGKFGGLYKIEGFVDADGRNVAEGSVTLGSADSPPPAAAC